PDPAWARIAAGSPIRNTASVSAGRSTLRASTIRIENTVAAATTANAAVTCRKSSQSPKLTARRIAGGPVGVQLSARYAPAVPDRLHYTDSDGANTLLAEDPAALLIGFVLDQQVPVQKAFAGPYVLKERLGTLDPARIAA